MTTAKAVKTTQNGKEVRYIIADLDCVKVEQIPQSVGQSGKFGINGTFFNQSSGDLMGVALNRTGTTAAPVKTGGNKTAYANSASGPLTDTRRGVLYHFNPAHPITSLEIDNKVVLNWSDFIGATSSNVKWAIGGISLHLDKTYTSTEYYDVIKNSPEYGRNLGHASPNGRSAIGFAIIGGQRKIILATFQNANYWEVRHFMKGLGCTKGVHLDGSGSSQLRYKRVINPVGSSVTETWEPKPDQPNGNRPVYNMVTVNPTTWEIASGF